MNTRFDLAAGSSEFYVDPVYYDHEFKGRTDDVRWYTQRYLEVGSPVLELAVGSGRIALKAVREGATVVGMDLAPAMLDRAAELREQLPKNRREHLQLFPGDMRQFRTDQTFRLVTCPFNAFMHMYTRDDVEQCLETVKAHLAPDGRFILDILTPDFDYLMRSPYKKFPGIRFRHPTYQAFYTYSERSAYDPITQLNQMWFHYEKCNEAGDGPPEVVIQLSHRYFYTEEIKALLHYNGFTIEECYGDFDNEPLSTDSDSMVMVCRMSDSAPTPRPDGK